MPDETSGTNETVKAPAPVQGSNSGPTEGQAGAEEKAEGLGAEVEGEIVMRTVICGSRVGNIGLLCDCGKLIHCRKLPLTESERKCPRCGRKSAVLPLERQLPKRRR